MKDPKIPPKSYPLPDRGMVEETKEILGREEVTRNKNVKDLVAIYNEAWEKACRAQKEFFDVVDPLRKAIHTSIQEARDARMALGTEFGGIIRALNDVKEMVRGAEHAKDMERLREFIEIAERLKALKDSGFLDAMVETILRTGERK